MMSFPINFFFNGKKKKLKIKSHDFSSTLIDYFFSSTSLIIVEIFFVWSIHIETSDLSWPSRKKMKTR